MNQPGLLLHLRRCLRVVNRGDLKRVRDPVLKRRRDCEYLWRHVLLLLHVLLLMQVMWLLLGILRHHLSGHVDDIVHRILSTLNIRVVLNNNVGRHLELFQER